MRIATIDSGTTNSRVYVADDAARVYAKITRQVGVRDTVRTGSRATLRAGVLGAFEEALSACGLSVQDIDVVAASGMITSEIGLVELDHLWAPAGMDELADGIERIDDAEVLPIGLPIHFVRGLKNRYDPAIATALDARGLDFMRGEETQLMGLLDAGTITPPTTVVILSSHTKFVPIDANGRILGSLTTISGQLFDAVMTGTSLGKSVHGVEESPRPGDHPDLVHAGFQWASRAGMLRGLFITRFLDTLLETSAAQRRLYLETVVASEDLKVISEFDHLDFPFPDEIVLIGNSRRSQLYEYLLATELEADIRVTTITDDETVDRLSIQGTLALLRRAGVLG